MSKIISTMLNSVTLKKSHKNAKLPEEVKTEGCRSKYISSSKWKHQSYGPLKSDLDYYQLPPFFFNSLVRISITKYKGENLQEQISIIKFPSFCHATNLECKRVTDSAHRVNEIHIPTIFSYTSPPIVIRIPVPER